MDFLTTVQNLLNESHSSNSMIDADPCFDLALVLKEIKEIGWANVQSIDLEFKHISLTYSDPDHRLISLNISIPHNYPMTPLTYESCIDFSSDDANVHSLVGIYDQFKNKVNLISNVWSEIEKIERDMLVAEEEDFDPMDYKRCILIGKFFFV